MILLNDKRIRRISVNGSLMGNQLEILGLKGSKNAQLIAHGMEVSSKVWAKLIKLKTSKLKFIKPKIKPKKEKTGYKFGYPDKNYLPEIRKMKIEYNHPLLGTPEYNKFYSSTAWRQLRYLALKNSGGCQCCGAKASNNVQLHVDHIKPRSVYPELELSLDNLQVLCQDCNLGKGAWDETDWRNKV